ncbi:MAG: tetratricopeptide repeat protein [Thermoflexibacter sp.]
MEKPSVLEVKNLILLGILVLTFIVFYGSLKNNFTNWDDDIYILNNFLIRDFSLENLGKIFLEPMGPSQVYRPLAYLTYMMDYSIWELNPFGYHLSSLLFHLLNVALVFYLLRLLSNNLAATSVVTLLFAIHPMKVEAIAWASARVDVVYATFYLSALIAYIFYIKNTFQIKYLIFSIILFIFSLLSKPAAVSFPLACLLIDYFYARKWDIKLILDKIPFIVLALAMGIVTLLAQKPDTAIGSGIEQFSLFERVFISSYTLLFYFFKIIFPVKLSNFYDFPQKLSFWHYGSLLLLGILAFAVYRIRENRNFIFGILFFVAHLLLVIHIIPTGNRFMAADRYTYLAQIGLLLSMFFWYLSAKENIRNILVGVVAVLSIFCILVSFNRNQVWNDGITLWSDAIIKNPDCSFCNFGLGNALINANQHKIAQPYIEKSILLNPNFAEAYNSRGSIKFALQDYDGAMRDYNKALEVNPNYQYAYASRGSVFAMQKKYAQAVEDYNKALSLNPNDILTYLNRGMARVQLRDFNGARKDLSIYIDFNPNNTIAYYHRGLANANLGRLTECCSDWKRAYDGGIRELKKNLIEACGYKNL